MYGNHAPSVLQRTRRRSEEDRERERERDSALSHQSGNTKGEIYARSPTQPSFGTHPLQQQSPGQRSSHSHSKPATPLLPSASAFHNHSHNHNGTANVHHPHTTTATHTSPGSPPRTALPPIASALQGTPSSQDRSTYYDPTQDTGDRSRIGQRFDAHPYDVS